MPPRPKVYKVVLCNILIQGPNNTYGFEWDLVGESTWATLKGAESRRKIVARKFPQYDTALQRIGGDIVFNLHHAWEPHLRARDWMPKPPGRIKKRKLQPRDPSQK